jgi:hypothetical protein
MCTTRDSSFPPDERNRSPQRRRHCRRRRERGIEVLGSRGSGAFSSATTRLGSLAGCGDEEAGIGPMVNGENLAGGAILQPEIPHRRQESLSTKNQVRLPPQPNHQKASIWGHSSHFHSRISHHVEANPLIPVRKFEARLSPILEAPTLRSSPWKQTSSATSMNRQTRFREEVDDGEILKRKGEW